MTDALKYKSKTPKNWSNHARYVFNNTYETMKVNQSVFLHPKANEVVQRLWNTVAWNAAWIAADYANEFSK